MADFQLDDEPSDELYRAGYSFGLKYPEYIESELDKVSPVFKMGVLDAVGDIRSDKLELTGQ